MTAEMVAPLAPEKQHATQPLRVLFAPDYRAGLTYQEDLARALVTANVETHFLSHYRRGLPLFRGCRDFHGLQALHVHWPEAYFRGPSAWRKARYAIDLSLAIVGRPLFLTAHNLYPHNRREEVGMRSLIRYTVKRSSAVFVHSRKAAELYAEEFGAAPQRCRLIPFGDHCQAVGSPLPRREARQQLGLPEEGPICLMFGTVSPYKGQEEVIAAWKTARVQGRLCIVGPVVDAACSQQLQSLAAGANNISLRMGDWLSPADLRLWLSAADTCIFNYKAILTSGAGCLARAFGLPILFPASLDAVDLGEPHPSVFRFEHMTEELPLLVERALSRGLRYEEAADYRAQSSWERVAESTAAVYREMIL